MDLFKSAAKGYTKYRGEYPKEVIEKIIAKLNLDGSGRLLDIGCGDGTLTFALSKYFKEVVAVDISIEMINEGKKRAKALGVNNINWIVKSANSLNDDIGRFDCITIAKALHWFDIEKVLSLSHKILKHNSAIVILGGKSIWNYAPTEWEKKIIEIIKKYLGPERMTINGKFLVSQKPYEGYLKEAGFKNIKVFGYTTPKGPKTVDEVLAEQFSTSYAAKELFGNRLINFEQELKNELLKIRPDNKFVSESRGDVIMGFK
ncbi:MAG: class I SAM-dependent methyltransferase [Patescibacteria group bacterium]|jgi:ubiquinone/menaquinone biosynthesis C-methylase UbiE